jgi:hypothetical protein
MSRIIARTLSLGHPMPGVLVDNYNVLSAPSFFDYDALVIDPHAASVLLESVLEGATDARSFSGAPIRSEPQHAGEVALADVVGRRRDETARLLENGGAIVVFAHPAGAHIVPGAGRVDDYWWLPLPEGIALAPPLLAPGEGSQAHVVDWEHPLAAFVSSQLSNIGYRAHFNARNIEGARVFAASHGGAAIGVELPLDSGRLIFLPALKSPPAGDSRYHASDALQSGIRHALGAMAPGRPPTWIATHSLPGLADRERMLSEARAAQAEANESVETAGEAFDELARFQRLLWQEGEAGLEVVVIDALRMIGCEVHAQRRESMELKCAEGTAILDIDAGEAAIDMAPHHRLRQRIERAIELRGVAPRAVLFVNGERLLAPERRIHITSALRLAAETMRYCVAPTMGLFEAVAAKLAGDDNAAAVYRARLIATDGLLA